MASLSETGEDLFLILNNDLDSVVPINRTSRRRSAVLFIIRASGLSIFAVPRKKEKYRASSANDHPFFLLFRGCRDSAMDATAAYFPARVPALAITYVWKD